MNGSTDAAQRFVALHSKPGGFIMPNAWDVGSALILAHAGFEAIATTSAGIAFSMGLQDYRISDAHHAVTREAMFDRIDDMVSALALPLSADLEAGYGDSPAQVADTVRRAIDAGLAGCNIEDKQADADALYDESLAVERIEAAAEVVRASAVPFVLTARTDAFVWTPETGLEHSIRRLNRYREVGAQCLYAPGPVDAATVGTLVRELDGPLNVVIGLGEASANAHELLALGVQRISVGGAIARAALGFVSRFAVALRDTGSIDLASQQIGQSELNSLFAAMRSG